MKFYDIATFLNISEMVAKSLAKEGSLPGRPCVDGWETTFDEIESWYIGLSGKEWANLVADGQVDPLAAEIDLETQVAADLLLSVLRSWEDKGVVKIMSHSLEPYVPPSVVVTICRAAENGRKGLESLGPPRHTGLRESTRGNIEVVYRCEKTLGENLVVATLSNEKILKLAIEDDIAELPQRDREIMRFLLTSYARQLSRELRGKCEGNTPSDTTTF